MNTQLWAAALFIVAAVVQVAACFASFRRGKVWVALVLVAVFLGTVGTFYWSNERFGNRTLAKGSPVPSPTPTPPPPASAPTPSPSPTTTTVDDSDPSIVYTRTGVTPGNWTQGTGSVFYGGSDHYNNVCQNPPQPLTPIQGPMAAISFNGTAISLIGEVGPQMGIGAYAVDAGSLHMVDAYSPTVKYQQTLFTVSGLSSGSHVLSYQVTCTKNAASSDFYQAIDAYVITGTPLSVSSAQAGKWNTVSLTGSWGSSATPDGSYGGTWSGTAGNTISWNFTGSLVEMYGLPDEGDGLFSVYIDNVLVALDVDEHYSTVDNDLLGNYMVWAQKVAYGTHTIKVVVLGIEDAYNMAEASGLKNLVQFTQFLAFP